MTCVGDWIKLHCGHRVRLVADERQVGTVRAVFHGAYVRVVWDGSGWISDHLFREVERIVEPRSAPWNVETEMLYGLTQTMGIITKAKKTRK